MSEVPAAALAWLKVGVEVAKLDVDGLGAFAGMAKVWRATLPAEGAVLVDVLDALRAVPVAVVADRHGVSVAEVEQAIVRLSDG